MLGYAGVCWRMLTYAYVSIRVLNQRVPKGAKGKEGGRERERGRKRKGRRTLTMCLKLLMYAALSY